MNNEFEGEERRNRPRDSGAAEDMLRHMMAQQQQQQQQVEKDVGKYIEQHVREYHPTTDPDNHEVMQRGAGWFKRMDSALDKVVTAIFLMALGAFGWGVVYMFNNKAMQVVQNVS